MSIVHVTQPIQKFLYNGFEWQSSQQLAFIKVTIARRQASGICIESTIRWVCSDRKRAISSGFHFHQVSYVNGKDVVVELDHKPLEIRF